MRAFAAALAACAALTLMAVFVATGNAGYALVGVSLFVVPPMLAPPKRAATAPPAFPGSLEALAARYLDGRLDLLDFLEAVDAWTPTAIRPSHQAGMLPTNIRVPSDAPAVGGLPPARPVRCSRCDIIQTDGGQYQFVCNGDCSPFERPYTTCWLHPRRGCGECSTCRRTVPK